MTTCMMNTTGERQLAGKSGKRGTYIPDRGDIIWISMTPQAGREQSGRHPALVLSPRRYNGKVGLALMCPITSRLKGYPFEVPLPKEMVITGVILSDQVRSLDWRVREAEFADKLPREVVTAVLERVMALLE